MGKNRWEINSSFNVTAADIIKAYSPPLWGHTHGHYPSSDAHTHDPWAAASRLVVPEEHSMVCRNIQYVPANVVQEVMEALGPVIEHCLDYFVFVLYPNNILFICCKLEDFCSFLRYDFLSSNESIRFRSGSDRARGKLCSLVHLSIHLSVCLSVHLSTCAWLQQHFRHGYFAPTLVLLLFLIVLQVRLAVVENRITSIGIII